MKIEHLAGVMMFVLAAAGCGTEAGDEERMFADGVGDDKCTVLTLEDVAAATGIPASEITQRSISGCLYSWDAGDGWLEGTVYLGSVRVHDSIERAKRDHARFTQDVTAEEVANAKEQAKEDLADEAAARGIMDAMPETDFKHRVLPGVGSEAVMDNRGSGYVRTGNVTINFSGKVDSEDRMHPEVAAEIGRRIVANLHRMADQ